MQGLAGSWALLLPSLLPFLRPEQGAGSQVLGTGGETQRHTFHSLWPHRVAVRYSERRTAAARGVPPQPSASVHLSLNLQSGVTVGPTAWDVQEISSVNICEEPRIEAGTK